jgi:hypothetical protein
MHSSKTTNLTNIYLIHHVKTNGDIIQKSQERHESQECHESKDKECAPDASLMPQDDNGGDSSNQIKNAGYDFVPKGGQSEIYTDEVLNNWSPTNNFEFYDEESTRYFIKDWAIHQGFKCKVGSSKINCDTGRYGKNMNMFIK